ncbi:hypothetical protein PENTCL1PPCAC_29239, partial [Pristionchus entomophagus]
GEGKSLEVKGVNALLDVVYDFHPSYFKSAEEVEALRAEIQQKIDHEDSDSSQFPIINKLSDKVAEYMKS